MPGYLTIQYLVHQHKIVLHTLLVELVEIALSERPQALEELKDQRGVRIALRDCYEVYVFVTGMTECCATEGEDGRSYCWVGDDLDAEDVGETRATVGPEGAENEVFALLVEYQNSGYHLDCEEWTSSGMPCESEDARCRSEFSSSPAYQQTVAAKGTIKYMPGII
jgi:hypothetical protein